jgi:hypothetical protein
MTEWTTDTDDINSEAEGDILPSQYFATVGSGGLSAEQRLMLAVLVDALNVLQSWRGVGSGRKRRDFAEAAQWVNCVGTTHPFSFDSICDVLEINSELLRSRLRELTIGCANSPHRPSIARLRLKELSRGQRMTPRQERRRKRVPHIERATIEPRLEPPSPSVTAPLPASASLGQAGTGTNVS